MVYSVFDQAVIHRPIIHLVKDFITECAKYNTVREKAQYGLPIIGNELELSSISLFKMGEQQSCDLAFSWFKTKRPTINSATQQKPRRTIDDFFTHEVLNEIETQGYSHSKQATLLKLNHPEFGKFEDIFIAPIRHHKNIYGYIAFKFDYPVQFDRELIDTLLTFSEMLSISSPEAHTSPIQSTTSVLLEHANDIIFILDQEGNIITASTAYKTIMDKDSHAFIGKDFREAFEFVSNNGYIALKSALSGQILQNVCLEVYTPSNQRKWLSFNFVPYTDKESHGEFILLTINDITYQKEIELNLRKSDTRSYLTSLATHDICYDWNYERNAVWWNNNIHDHFGYPHTPSINNRHWWMQQIHPDDISKVDDVVYEAIIHSEPTYSIEYRFKHANGDYFYVNDTAFISYNQNGTVTRMTGSIKDINEQRLAERALRISRDSLSKLAHRLQDVREDERKKLSRELHDEFAQLLTALKLDVAYLDRKGNIDKTQVKTMNTVVDQMMNRVQTISRELRPTILDDLGLIHAINWQLNNFYELTDCDVNFINHFDKVVFKRDAVTCIFRIFQEALSNVARHANASEVFVTVENVYSRFALTIKDNGKGIPKHLINDPNAIGLLGMKERAYALNGNVFIKRNEHQGTSITLLIPMIECIKLYKNKNKQCMMTLPSKTEGELIN